MTESTKGTVRAILLREMEPNLFRAAYPGEINPDEAGVEVLPDSHIGTDAAGVRQWVETMAKGIGYNRVAWEPPKAAASR
jgi:hypothetical protein